MYITIGYYEILPPLPSNGLETYDANHQLIDEDLDAYNVPFDFFEPYKYQVNYPYFVKGLFFAKNEDSYKKLKCSNKYDIVLGSKFNLEKWEKETLANITHKKEVSTPLDHQIIKRIYYYKWGKRAVLRTKMIDMFLVKIKEDVDLQHYTWNSKDINHFALKKDFVFMYESIQFIKTYILNGMKVWSNEPIYGKFGPPKSLESSDKIDKTRFKHNLLDKLQEGKHYLVIEEIN